MFDYEDHEIDAAIKRFPRYFRVKPSCGLKAREFKVEPRGCYWDRDRKVPILFAVAVGHDECVQGPAAALRDLVLDNEWPPKWVQEAWN